VKITINGCTLDLSLKDNTVFIAMFMQ